MQNFNFKSPRPGFSQEEIRTLTRELYGVQAVSITPLASELDLNFHLRDEAEAEYVCKIANHGRKLELLQGQNEALKHHARHHTTLKCPALLTTLKGEEIARVKSARGDIHRVRLLTFLPGRMFGDLVQHSSELLRNLGRVLGEMDRVFRNFYHPAFRRHILWDLKNFTELEKDVGLMKDSGQRRLVLYYFQLAKTFVLPVFSRLRQSVIHNDFNDFNIVIREEGKKAAIDGIIDFGDMVHTFTICNLAVAAAYALHNKPDPMDTIALITGSYHKMFPLEDTEIDILFYLICLRICSTLVMSARQLQSDPGNEYLKISVEPAVESLEKLIRINPDKAASILRQACQRPYQSGAGFLSLAETLKNRKERLGRNLSLSYQKPLKIVRGAMQYLYDDTGKAFLDTVNNVCHVGHCHPRVVEAAQKQMAILNTNTRYLHDNIVEYARRLVELLPDPLQVCYFVNSGSEANELALRMARCHTKRSDLMVIDHAYHGNTNDVIEISPYKFDGPGGGGKPDHVHKVLVPDAYRGTYKYGQPELGLTYARDVLRVVGDLQQKQRPPAAFIHESLMSVAGQIVLPDNYLPEAYKIIRSAGGLCIADEVQVGFGRAGSHTWAFKTQGVVPDIVTLGKPIGNGHPLAALITTPEIADSFNNGMEYFNTFGGNPVSCAVGLAVLMVIQDEQLQRNALRVGKYLLAGLKELMNRHPLIGDVRGLGLFIGIELVDDRDTLEPAAAQAALIAERMKEEGILISIDGPLYNVIKFKPPMMFTKSNADLYINTLDKILATL